MHVHQVRKVPGIPGETQQTILQFPAARARGHPHGTHILGADLGIADDADARDLGQ